MKLFKQYITAALLFFCSNLIGMENTASSSCTTTTVTTQQERFSCPKCGHILANNEQLHAHWQLHFEPVDAIPQKRKKTAKIAKENYFCTHCKKTYLTQGKLKLHLASHSTERKFCCDRCPKKFKIKSHLTEHTRTHTGEKPFECRFPDCNKKFAQSSVRYQHEKTHKNTTTADLPTVTAPSATEQLNAALTQLYTISQNFNVEPVDPYQEERAHQEEISHTEDAFYQPPIALRSPSPEIDKEMLYWYGDADLPHGIEPLFVIGDSIADNRPSDILFQ